MGKCKVSVMAGLQTTSKLCDTLEHVHCTNHGTLHCGCIMNKKMNLRNNSCEKMRQKIKLINKLQIRVWLVQDTFSDLLSVVHDHMTLLSVYSS